MLTNPDFRGVSPGHCYYCSNSAFSGLPVGRPHCRWPLLLPILHLLVHLWGDPIVRGLCFSRSCIFWFTCGETPSASVAFASPDSASSGSPVGRPRRRRWPLLLPILHLLVHLWGDPVGVGGLCLFLRFSDLGLSIGEVDFAFIRPDAKSKHSGKAAAR